MHVCIIGILNWEVGEKYMEDLLEYNVIYRTVLVQMGGEGEVFGVEREKKKKGEGGRRVGKSNSSVMPWNWTLVGV